MSKIQVLIVDDHAVVRQGLEAILFAAEDIEVVGQAADGREAVGRAAELEPDVVLMDVLMPKLTGDLATAEILRRQPDVKVLVLSGSGMEEKIISTLRAGAQGYVSKSAPDAEIVEAVRRIHAGKLSMPPELTRRLLARYEPTPASPEVLTPREVEILLKVAQGLTNQEIAGRLHLSPGTVRAHLSNIFGKLGVSNRVEATLHALREGVTTLEACLDPAAPRHLRRKS